VALLGDMLELGPLTEEAHREAGRRAAATADRILAVGEAARGLAEEARRLGAHVDWVPDAEAAERWCRTELRPGDHVYVKASRAIELDRLVGRLEAWGGPS
ncbi:MAG: glutamate ligase domain-containing protein, partial [Clostridia bacterium]